MVLLAELLILIYYHFVISMSLWLMSRELADNSCVFLQNIQVVIVFFREIRCSYTGDFNCNSGEK